MKETKFKQTEIGMIPDDWEVKNIGELYSVHNGLSKDASYFGKGNPFLSFSTVFNNVFIPEKLEKKVLSNNNEQKIFSIHKGDVFITRTSETVDELGMSSVSLKDYPQATFNGFCKRLRLKEEEHVDNRYIGYFFRSSLIRNRILKYSTVTTRASLKNEELLNLPLIFPTTLAEQQKIAKALSDVDNVISTLEKLITKKKNLKQGTMQQLLTGKKRLPGFTQTTATKQTELGEIPADWEVKELGDVGKMFSTGATPYRAVPAYYKGYIKWVSSGELNYNYIQDSIEHISELGRRNTNLKIHPKGTFLMAITGLEAAGTRGRCAILDTEATTNQSCLAIYPTNELDMIYFFYYYQQNGDDFAFKYCQGSKQQSYTASIVKKFMITLPSKSEQTAIANVLSSMDKEIEALNTKLEKYRNLKTGMMQQLLTGKIRLR